MKLFLASDAKHPESISKLHDFVGESLTEKNIVYIPTAANGEYVGSWKTGESIKVAKSLTNKFTIVELENSFSEDIMSTIRSADILWMAGGMSGYLLYWIRRTRLDTLIPKMLESGTIYVGSSAGSMICARTQNSAEWYLADPEPGASLIPGLGFIDFEIYPHYEDEMLPEIKKHWKTGKLCLLKNGEVVTVDNDEVAILGEERYITK